MRDMVRSKKAFLVIFLVSFSLSLAFGRPGLTDEKELAPKYQEWLKLVSYIITDQEREVFLKLKRDADREAFIESFWKMRDPTPGTPENEYKEEIIKRFEYVNTNFKRGSSREGWQTDMGRIYMILGPPASIERIEGKTGIVPCQIWTYYGDVSKGLPSHFVLVFFQKAGVGEYKLYDPLADGPYSLLENKREVDWEDYEGIYETIKKIAPTLAVPALTIVPGEYSPTYYQPSPRNAIILKKILESPKKDINPTYATNFLKYSGLVSTEYLTNYIESDAVLEIMPEPETGVNFVHFIISPKSLSVDYYEPKNQYYCNFTLNVSVRAGDKIVFQYNREIPFYFPEADLPKVKANGLAIEDSFPIAEGQYQVNVLLQNTVGKEFSTLEKSIKVAQVSNRPTLFGPFIGYKTQKFNRQQHLPFKIGEEKLILDPRMTLSAADQIIVMLGLENLDQQLWQKGYVEIAIKGLKPENRGSQTIKVELNQGEFSRLTGLWPSFKATDFPPDYYEIRARLIDGEGKVIDEKKGNFIISAEQAIGHPLSQVRIVPLAFKHLFYYILARQYEETNQDEKADYFYQTTLSLKPDYQEALVSYGQFLLRRSQFARVLDLSARLSEDPKQNFAYHSLRGRAFLGLKDYQKAIEELTLANQIYDSDITVINALGLALYGKGDKNKAREAFRASLKLNPDQPEIKKLLAQTDNQEK